MTIKWVKNEISESASIYASNITINTSALNHFKDSIKAMVGYDSERKAFVIKKIRVGEESKYDSSSLHDLVHKDTYGRISGTNIVKGLCGYAPLDFSAKSFHKFKCDWNDEDECLFINLSEEVEK